MKRRIMKMCLLTACTAMLVVGCGSTKKVECDVTKVQSDISKIEIPENVMVVGLGEASHGAKEYQEMKLEVFKTLVENKGCHTFILEGDFGGCLKVDNYINGGEGCGKDIIKEIGFGIYRTEEMVNLIEWMRSYNEKADESQKLHFYGMDMQRFDNSKEYVTKVLKKSAPQILEKYESNLQTVTNDNRFDIERSVLDSFYTSLKEMLIDIESNKEQITSNSDVNTYNNVWQCVNSMNEYMEILTTPDSEYNKLRDQYMFGKVEWIIENSVDSIVFINGHNGHIGKESVSNYKCLGNYLSEKYGNGYFSIGTDAGNTDFSNQNDDGSFRQTTVKNENNMTYLAGLCEGKMYYIDFNNEKIKEDESWQQVISTKQAFTTLNVSVADSFTKVKTFVTTSFVPNKNYDAMIIYDSVTPTTIIE